MFFFLAYFTLYNRLQFHPSHQNWFKWILFNGWVILHCVYVPQLSYPFICWWTSNIKCLLKFSYLKCLYFLKILFHCCCWVASVVSNSVRPHRWQPNRLLCPWDSPGKNTGVGCHFLLQCMKVKSESEVAQSCLTLSDPMDCSLPGPSIHRIFQARVLEWGAIAFSNVFTREWKLLFPEGYRF